jgi:hypothetical protein
VEQRTKGQWRLPGDLRGRCFLNPPPVDEDVLAATCAKCPLSLVCLSNKPIDEGNVAWCETCRFFWIPELKVQLLCGTFIGRTSFYKVPGCEYCDGEVRPSEITLVTGYPTIRPMGQNRWSHDYGRIGGDGDVGDSDGNG